MCKLFKVDFFLPEWRINLKTIFHHKKRNILKKCVGLKWVKKNTKGTLWVTITKDFVAVFAFGPGRVKRGAETEESTLTRRVLSQHPGSLVLFLGLPVVSLIVDHSEQNPQVQKRDDEEPHQNCDKETPFNTRMHCGHQVLRI